MRIACPKCAAEYTLDERLLPPGGAPVQCTTCNHVFTAEARANPAPAPEPVRRNTAEFGIPELPPAPSPQREVPASVPARAAAAPANQTMRFGAFVPPNARPAGGTQRFGAVGAPGPKDIRLPGHEEPAAARNTTRVFGAIAPPTRPEPSTATATPTGQPATIPPSPFAGLDGDDPLATAPARRTLVFGAGTPVELPVALGKAGGEPSPELSPGVIPGPEKLTIYEDEPPLIPAPVKRRLVRGGLLAALVVVIAFFGIRLSERLRATPADLVAQEQSALNLLRLDDPASRKQARTQLEQVIARAPRFVEPRADRVLLLALALDDVRAPLKLIETEIAGIDADIQELSEAKTPSDWRVRVNTLRDRKVALAKERARIAEDAKARQVELERALNALPPATEDSSPRNLAVIRARAIAAGVAGTGAALELAERYGTLGDPGGWSALTLAEYAINAHAPPETVEEVRVKLRDLKTRDPAFLRPYVLLGRLDLSENRRTEALSELEAALALNPDHVLARRLLSALGRTGEDGAGP